MHDIRVLMFDINCHRCQSFFQEKRMRALIHKPLRELRDLLVGPKNLIKKRLDKLLDYEVIEGKSKLSYEEQAVANAYK